MKPVIKQDNKRRIAIVFAVMCLVLLLLTFKIAVIQIVKAEEYTEKAIAQQTKDTIIEPKRGIIYDRNGKELATSVICYALWIRPADINTDYDEAKRAEMAEAFAPILEMESQKIKELFMKEQALVCVSKYLTKEQAKAIRDLKYKGVELVEGTRRYYPLGNFASQLLGSVNDENVGRTGIELQYDQYLKGVAGRWVKNTDLTGNELVGGTESYFEQQDGLNVVLTIDEAVQYYAEKAISDALEKTKASRIMCLIMNPKTGEILANAVTPGYDPNSPYSVSKKDKKKYDKMDNTEKTAYLSKMWKNPIVSDTYEPGSTFKLITASAAIEERAVKPGDTFVCNGSFRVADYVLHCWTSGAHGVQTLKEAVGNSCNPAMAAVAKRLGKTRMHKYIDLFGITEKTGIDYPGEASAIIQSLANTGPVELATIGYGQGISLTPIQLLTACNAIGNKGVLVEPHYVKGLADGSGKLVQEYEPKIVRKVISNKTAEDMKEIMEYVVAKGGGGNAKIPGYRIGGKTGTANKVENGVYGHNYYSSFLGMVPVNDPELSILVIVDSPKTSIYGSVVAAPIAKEILQDLMRYMNISPEYTSEEQAALKGENTKVPNVIGKDYAEAAGILGGAGLRINKPDSVAQDENFIVVDQYPKAGSKVRKNSIVYVYGD